MLKFCQDTENYSSQHPLQRDGATPLSSGQWALSGNNDFYATSGLASKAALPSLVLTSDAEARGEAEALGLSRTYLSLPGLVNKVLLERCGARSSVLPVAAVPPRWQN